jgi:hypothetical protein
LLSAEKKKKEEDEKKRKAEEDEKKKKEEERKKRDADLEAEKKRTAEEEKKRKEAEDKRKKEEAEAKKREEEEKAKKQQEDDSKKSPATSDAAAKRTSIAERTAKWNSMIVNPGGKPKDPEPVSSPKITEPEPEPKKDIKKELESVLANPGGRKKPATEEPKPVEKEDPAEKLQFPTAERPKGPQGRRPSQRHISRGNSMADEDDNADIKKEEEQPKKADPKPEPVKAVKEEPKKSDSPKVATKVDSSSSKDVEEIARLKSELSTAQSSVKQLKQELEEVKEEMEEALSKKDSTISDMKKKNKDLEDDVEDLEDQLDKARGGAAKAAPSDDSVREIKKLKDQVSQLEDKLKKAQDDADSLRKDLTAAKQAAAKARKDEDSEDDEPTQSVLKTGASAVSDDAVAKAKAQVALLQRQLDNRGKLMELLYGARWSYEASSALEGTSKKVAAGVAPLNPSRPAFELGEYLLRQKAFDVKSQHDEANQQLLKEVLVALHSQYKRASDQADVSAQIGWLAHSASLMWTLMRPGILDKSVCGEEEDDSENESDEDSDEDEESSDDDKSDESSESEDESQGRKLKKITKDKNAKPAKIPPHSIFWARYVAERGIHCGYDDVKECLEDLKGVDVEEELSVDDDDGPARRFLDVLDMLISHQYSLLVDCMQKKIGQDKLNDVFFDQSAVLQASVVGPRKREGSQRAHSPTIITGQLEQFVQLLKKSHPFSKALELQIIAQMLEWIGRHLTNALFTTAQLCRAGTAYSMKVALSHVEQWFAGVIATSQVDPLMTAWVNERLEPLREAANILLIDKSTRLFVFSEICVGDIHLSFPFRRVR